jgi:hypothetical protein
MKLRDLAHSRTGDKGNTSNISVIAYRAEDFALIREFVTAERVQAQLAGLNPSQVTRYELPKLGALNFVVAGALGGGVTRSLALDAHGKALSSILLDMDLEPARTGARSNSSEP